MIVAATQVTTLTWALVFFVLIAFTILIDMLGKKRWCGLLIDSGQNPMIAYVGQENLVHAVLVLVGINQLLIAMSFVPWLGFVGGVITTLLVALTVSFFTPAFLL